MKKFALKTTAAAVALLAAGAAFAGTVTVTAPTYAVEDLTAATTVTFPAVTYDTGVIGGVAGYKLTPNTNYRIIFTLPAGMTWNGTPALNVGTSDQIVPAAADAVSGACSPISYSGQLPNELAFGCSIANDTTPGVAAPAKFTLAASTAAAGNLATADTEIKLVKVATQSIEGATSWDTVSNTLYAKSAKAITLQHLSQGGAVGNDTDTVTDANYVASGVLKPLNGFVVTGDDTALKAQAKVKVFNNPANYVRADGVTLFDMTGSTGGAGAYVVSNAVTFTVKDTRKFQGLAANGLQLNNTSFSVNTGTGEATLVVSGNSPMFPAQGANGELTLSYQATGNDSLGTTRQLDLQGVVAGGGTAVTLNDGITDWWKWGTNGMELRFAAISYKANTPSWIQLTNYSKDADASYTAICYTKNQGTAGTPGVVPKDTTQRVELQQVCGNKTTAESVQMTFATKAGNINGAVVRKNATSGDVTYINASSGNSQGAQ